MDDPETLTPLDPAFESLLRTDAAILALILLIAAALAEAVTRLTPGLFLIPVLVLNAWLLLFLPARRYRRWGYVFGTDRLRVVRGFLSYRDTVVPLGRIQHIDVHQGPLMRRWDLARLTVHTAGNHGASVSLPGLKLAQAEAIREAIRLHIKLGSG